MRNPSRRAFLLGSASSAALARDAFAYSLFSFAPKASQAVAQAPTVVAASNPSVVTTADWAGKTVATLSSNVADVTYSIVSGGADFSIGGNRLRLEKPPGSVGSSVSCTVRATNAAGAVDQTFTYTVAKYSTPSLIARFNALDLSKLKQDTAKTVAVAANGDPIGSWVDSISGWELQQATAAARPTLVTNAINGQPVIRFDGTNDFMASVTSALTTFGNAAGQALTFIVIGTQRTAADCRLMTWANGSARTQEFDLGATGICGLSRTDVNHSALTAVNTGAGTTYPPATTAGSPGIYAVSLDGVSRAYHAANGAPAAISMAGAALYTAGANSATMNVGRIAASSSTYAPFDFAEILIFNSYLSKEQLYAITQDLAATWGVTITQPGAALDLSGYTLVHANEFDVTDPLALFNSNTANDYMNGAMDGYLPGIALPHSNRSTYATPSSNSTELQTYIDPRNATVAASAAQPFAVNNSVLSLRAEPTPAALIGLLFPIVATVTSAVSADGVTAAFSATLNANGVVGMIPSPGSGLAGVVASISGSTITMTQPIAGTLTVGQQINFTKPYVNAAFTTYGVADVQYPYFEVLAKMPTPYSGNWPAWWALASNGHWPTEIDVLEQFGIGNYRGDGFNYTLHQDPYWPFGGTSDNGWGASTYQNDYSADYHWIGADVRPEGISVYVDRRLVGTFPLMNGLTGVTVNNAGDGTIPAGNLTVIVKGARTNGKLVFTTSAGFISALSSVSNVGQGIITPAQLYRADGVTPLGYGVDLSISVANETVIPPHYHMPLYFIANFALGAGSGGAMLAGDPTTRSWQMDALRVYTKNYPTPSIASSTPAEATSIYNAMTSAGAAPSSGQQAAIKNFINQAKAWQMRYDVDPFTADWDTTKLSLWDAMDLLYVMFTQGSTGNVVQALNWKAPGGGNNLIFNGSPTIAPLHGVAFGGVVGQYAETSYGLGSGPQFDPWDHHMGLLIRTGASNSTWASAIGGASTVTGNLGSTDLVYPTTQSQSCTLYSALATPNGLKAPGACHFVWARGWRMAQHLFRNGKLVQAGYSVTQTTKPSRLSGNTIKIGAYTSGVAGAAFEASVAHVGRRLMMDETAKLNALLLELRDAYGAS